MAASARSLEIGSYGHFDAIAAFYAPCNAYPPTRDPYTMILRHNDRPLLVLMGGEDTEAPPAECIDHLKAEQEKGAPITWHLYPHATHCRDCSHLNGNQKMSYRGVKVIYRYDQKITEDSARRMFEFFDTVFVCHVDSS